MDKILIIVPAYNESGNIRRTVQEIRDWQGTPGIVDILVIDDGSRDTTAAKAEAAGALVISLPFNLGIGGAVQTGFQYACRNHYDIAVQVDGDGQHDLRYLKKLLAPVQDGVADVTIGSRFIKPFLGYRSSFIRRAGIHFFSYLITFLTRCKITDPTSGFRAFNKKSIKVFADDYPTDFPEPEAIVIAGQVGLRVKEVPVQMRPRAAGHSSIRYLKTLYYMVKVTCAVILSITRRKRRVA